MAPILKRILNPPGSVEGAVVANGGGRGFATTVVEEEEEEPFET